MAALVSMNVWAMPITLDFEGYVQHLEQDGGLLESSPDHIDIQVGDSVMYSLTFDVDNLDYTRRTSNLSVGYRVDIAGLTWQDTGTYFLSTRTEDFDTFYAFENAADALNDTTNTLLGFFTSVINVDDISAMLAGEEFTLLDSLGTMTFGDQNGDFAAKVAFSAPSASVPEPGVIALLSLGLISLFAGRRRRA